MKKPQLLFLAASLCGMAAVAQTDVTATTLANPSFEADKANCTSANAVSNDNDGLRGWKVTPQGWTMTATGTDLLISKDCYTDNNFGKTAIADGEYAFYQRVGWSDATSSLSQTTSTPLDKGTYELSFVSKGFCANNANSSANYSVKDAAGKMLGENSFSCVAGSAGIMASSPWDKRTLRFSVTEPTAVTIALNMTWKSGGSCMAFDNFKIVKISDVPDDPNAPQNEGGTEDEVESPTEGKLSGAFVSEAEMMDDMLQMLADFTQYGKNIYTNASNNSQGGATGYFKANSAGNSNEDGVRTNADLSMLFAFVYKYGNGKVTLPAGLTMDQVKDMALKSLRWGYSTHKANNLLKTTNNANWGSMSTSNNQWESSLWTMSLAYAAHFLADELTQAEKDCIYKMIVAECEYELQRTVPTGYSGDTKAEENGWEVDVLACALGLYPNDAKAPQWFDKLRAFAINSYSQADDANNKTVIDPDYDNKTVADYFKGACLYPDYTLQNHNYFHTSYQNVVMQELGEAKLALELFQGANPKWKTNALMHNNQKVMDEVLVHLALADGELAMPNGNDWSMFLFDQITSYATAACFLGDPNALMLENLAYKNIKARQTTTADGSWLLNSDIGPRRMGVEGHRVMMTYLMHKLASTASLTPTSWTDFSKANENAKLFTTQNIVRANTPDRYTIFSWSAGLGNYTGYFVPNNPDLAKIVVPYKANGTGNMLGWYVVDGKSTNVTPVVSGIYNIKGNSYAMNGKLNTNANTLSNAFAIYSTPGNAVIYVDYVTGIGSGSISREYGGLLAISVDPFTKPMRTIYHEKGRFQSDGSNFKTVASRWANVDNAIGVIVADSTNSIAFGEKGNNCSISTAKLIASYGANSRAFAAGDVVDARSIVYYSGVNAETTGKLANELVSLRPKCAAGWNGAIAADPDGVRYMLLANFAGAPRCEISGVSMPEGCPVFSQATTIAPEGSSATFVSDVNGSIADVLRVYLNGQGVTAIQVPGDSCAVIVTSADGKASKVDAVILYGGSKLEKKAIAVPATDGVKISVANGQIVAETVEIEQPEKETYVDITEKFLTNPSFEADKSWAKVGSCELGGVNYNPCYLNELDPVSSKFPQVLPLEGWTPVSTLDGSSNFAVRYSMPYSPTMYCVSPSTLGNSASIMSAPALFPEAGDRCLSVMNSWTFGKNAATQTVKLPAGNYKLKFLAQYVCANEASRPADDQIEASNNSNFSLCGISMGSENIFRYPSKANVWEEIVIPFSLEAEADVEVSMGLRTTASVGAANNTRLYLDYVRLYSEKDIDPNGILGIAADDNAPVDVYNLQGMRVLTGVDASAAASLPAGVYIVGNRKVHVR